MFKIYLQLAADSPNLRCSWSWLNLRKASYCSIQINNNNNLFSLSECNTCKHCISQSGTKEALYTTCQLACQHRLVLLAHEVLVVLEHALADHTDLSEGEQRSVG